MADSCGIALLDASCEVALASRVHACPREPVSNARMPMGCPMRAGCLARVTLPALVRCTRAELEPHAPVPAIRDVVNGTDLAHGLRAAVCTGQGVRRVRLVGSVQEVSRKYLGSVSEVSRKYLRGERHGPGAWPARGCLCCTGCEKPVGSLWLLSDAWRSIACEAVAVGVAAVGVADASAPLRPPRHSSLQAEYICLQFSGL